MTRRLVTRDSALKHQSYLDLYEQLFAPLADRPVVLLELGVADGGSLLLWRDFFPRGTIVGVDARLPELDEAGGRVQLYAGLQQDTALLDRVAQAHAPLGFDIVIDDCAHVAELARASFWHLFDNHLKPGGLYVVEDWGTGYWDAWPDGERYRGPGHDAGMVGLVKELVDECGVQDIAYPNVDTLSGADSPPRVPTKIERLIVTAGQVVVVKADAPGRGPGAYAARC